MSTLTQTQVLVKSFDESNQRLKTSLNGLVTEAYDTVQVTASTADGPTEIVFKTGGTGGTIVATLTITYSLSKLASVVKN